MSATTTALVTCVTTSSSSLAIEIYKAMLPFITVRMRSKGNAFVKGVIITQSHKRTRAALMLRRMCHAGRSVRVLYTHRFYLPVINAANESDGLTHDFTYYNAVLALVSAYVIDECAARPTTLI